MSNPNIRFPILRRLVVKNYGLFPGANGNGIDHRFEPGVTVIPGVNGLGKTTLLNIIYRLLVGPFDPYKSDEIQLTQRRLKELRYFYYFSKRDQAASTNGTACGEFSFGERKLIVERRLDDLSIVTLQIDETDLAIHQLENPEDEIWQLAGCSSQYDFHLIVRSVVFFLEEKTPVVWDPVAQAEIFRIVFLKADDALDLAEMAAEIQVTDSRARNMYDQLRRYKEQLLSMQARSSAATEVTKRTKFIQKRLPVLERQIQRLTEATEKLESTRNTNRGKLDALKLDLEEMTRHLEFRHHEYFASLFPQLPDVARNVLLNLVGDNGCLVCGSRRAGLSAEVRELAERGTCPVCHSPKKEQEPTVMAMKFGSKIIKRDAAKVEKLKETVTHSQATVNANDEEYHQALNDLLNAMTERDQLLAEADSLRTQLPVNAEQLSQTESYITFTDREIKRLRRRNKALLRKYTISLAALSREVRRHRNNMALFFSEYAASFLAEQCGLTYAPQDLRLGQAVDTVEYPTFAVQMTSAVTPTTGTTRKQEDDVSESQKEFIDLAFRMAVMKAYAISTNVSAGAMLVIETPEASLDSVFIGNAGAMLRNWCADPSPGVNSVIATSNLNRENMIAALLGLNKRPRPKKSIIRKHVLNLLEIAAENATLRQHRGDYERQFRESTTLNN
jgi:peptidoglycan hydrolase CwlO-like protein